MTGNIEQHTHVAAARSVARRFRIAEARMLGGRDRELLEAVRDIALADALVLLDINPASMSPKPAPLSVAATGHPLPGRCHAPVDLLHERLHIPSIPGGLERLSAHVQQGGSDEELEKIIRHDMALTLAVLRLVNSPLYAVKAGAPGGLGSVHGAVSIVGGRQLAALALAATKLGQQAVHNLHGLPLEEFWQHSLMTACLARSLARQVGAEDADAHFTAGLLHDLGRLLMVERLGAGMVSLYAHAESRGVPFHDAERDVLGFDHGAVGAALLRRWSIDERLAVAVEEHHALDAGDVGSEFAAVVAVADFMARALGYGYWGDLQAMPPAKGAWSQLGVPVRALGTVAREAYAEYEKALFVFGPDRSGTSRAA